jgi:hypothetical protein
MQGVLEKLANMRISTSNQAWIGLKIVRGGQGL